MCEVRVKRIVMLCGSDDLKRGVFRRLVEHIDPIKNQKLNIESVEPISTDSIYEFSKVMHRISSEVKEEGAPILNFYFHGCAEKGLLLQSKEYVSWSLLNELLRGINKQILNTMCVISMACHSFKSIYPPDMFAPAPYSVLFAPTEEITQGQIEIQVCKFYTALLTNGSLDEASKEMTAFERFIPEVHILKALDGALKETHGRAGAKSREEAMTRALGVFPDMDKKKYRSILKNYGKKNPDDVKKRLAGVFMCGRDFCLSVISLENA